MHHYMVRGLTVDGVVAGEPLRGVVANLNAVEGVKDSGGDTCKNNVS